MNAIREYYEPLKNAIKIYKETSEEILIKENFLEYCEDVLSKKQKKKKFKKIVKMNKKERRFAWSFVKMENIRYIGISSLVLILSGILGGGLQVLLIILFVLGLGAFNVYLIPSALKEELEYRYLANYLDELDDKDVDLKGVIKQISAELVMLRDKKEDLSIYLKKYEEEASFQENAVANEILAKNGIDASIDITVKEKVNKESIKDAIRMLVLRNLFKDED